MNVTADWYDEHARVGADFLAAVDETVEDIAGAVAAVDQAGSLDRAAIRTEAVARFGVDRMVDEYLAAYAAVIDGGSVRH